MKRYLTAVCAALFTLNTFALDDFDLYKYGDTKIKIERTEFIVKLILFDTAEELIKEYSKVTGVPIEEANVRAFTSVSAENDVCFINIVTPKIWDDRESLTIIGHELIHCGLATHQDAAAELAEKEKEWKDKNKKQTVIDKDTEFDIESETELLLKELEAECKIYEERGHKSFDTPPAGCAKLGTEMVTEAFTKEPCPTKDVVVERDVIDTAVNVGLLTLEEAEQLRKDIAAGIKDVIDVISPDGILSFGTITYDDDQ